VLTGTRPNGQDDTPRQYAINIDKEKASALNLSLSDINATMSTAWGGTYVNDFTDRGRVKRVYVQGGRDFPHAARDLDRWYVRNADGAWCRSQPLPRQLELRLAASRTLQRRVGGRDPGIGGEQQRVRAKPWTRSIADGAVAARLQPRVDEPVGAGKKLSGNQALALYAISILVVFLALAALYESWSNPACGHCLPCRSAFSVPLVAPRPRQRTISIQGRPADHDRAFGKNAILIVELRKSPSRRRKDLVGLRRLKQPGSASPHRHDIAGLHPGGVLPLATAQGAGSGSQNSIGIGVMAG